MNGTREKIVIIFSSSLEEFDRRSITKHTLTNVSLRHSLTGKNGLVGLALLLPSASCGSESAGSIRSRYFVVKGQSFDFAQDI